MSTNHLDVVQAVKADLAGRGVPLSGSCGAFRILYGVAVRLNTADPARPWGFLLKTGGNRAVPQADGSCLSGDETTEPGYATDYLIDKRTMFGYDVLGDGGGANNPQWPDEPETAPDMVARNTADFRAPEPWGAVIPGPTDPPIEEPPGELPPGFPISESDFLALLRQFSTDVATLKTLLADANSLQVLQRAEFVDDVKEILTGLTFEGEASLGRFLGTVTITLHPVVPQ